MQIKTTELTGAALDWAVAKCEGFSDWDAEDKGFQLFGEEPGWWSLLSRSYSTHWSQCGPIIYREGIGTNEIGFQRWSACIDRMTHSPTIYWGVGPTPLIAACRCYVASELGDEVEVPDELILAI